MKLYASYQDDGAAGICGQTIDVTNPRSRLYVFVGSTYEECMGLIRDMEQQIRSLSSVRQRPRFTATWWDAPDHPFLENQVIAVSRLQQQTAPPTEGEVKP